MKLYVSNCTHQNHFFNYKLPENPQPFGVLIKPGTQEVITQPPEVIRCIIEQHEPYGFVDIKKVRPGFSGLCYSIDKPVSSSQILDAHEQKQEDLEDMSQEILENTTACFARNLENTMQQAGSTDPVGDVEVKITGEAINKDQAAAPKLEKRIVATNDTSRGRAPRTSRR